MMDKVKDILLERIVLAGLFLLMCAARCQAQDLIVTSTEYDSITQLDENGRIGWVNGSPVAIWIQSKVWTGSGVNFGYETHTPRYGDCCPTAEFHTYERLDNLVYHGGWGGKIQERIMTDPPIDDLTYHGPNRTLTWSGAEWFAASDTTPPTSVITAVHDGDSYYFRGLIPSNKFARLNGVDCPEISSPYVGKTQPYGREIGDSVRVLLKGKNITYTLYGLDKYKRPLVGVFVDENDVAETILEKGWAWYYSPNNLPSATKKRYKALERAAKKKKLGLWADPAPIKPTLWRKQHPGLK